MDKRTGKKHTKGWANGRLKGRAVAWKDGQTIKNPDRRMKPLKTPLESMSSLLCLYRGKIELKVGQSKLQNHYYRTYRWTFKWTYR